MNVGCRIISVENGITGKMTIQKAQPMSCLGEERNADMAKNGRVGSGGRMKTQGTTQREKVGACHRGLSGFFVWAAEARERNQGSRGTGL